MSNISTIKRIEALSKFSEDELKAAIQERRRKAEERKAQERINNIRQRIIWITGVEQACKERFGVGIAALLLTRSNNPNLPLFQR